MNASHKRARSLNRLFVIALLISSAAFAQEGAIDPGTLVKDTYVNRSLGFTLKLPPSLIQDKQALAEAPHNQQTSVLISAWTDIPRGSLRPGMVLSADRLSYYPADRRTSEAYVARVVRAQVADGYQVLHERIDRKIGLNTLHCTDLKKTVVYETVCVATRRGFALMFIYTGSGQEQVETMMRSTGLNFAKE